MISIRDQVEQLFAEANDRHEEVRRNPVTDSQFVSGLDPIEPQKEIAIKALMALAWFETERPLGAPKLPLNYGEREALKGDAEAYLIALFARSLAARDFNTEGHPHFDEYARDVMASPLGPDVVRGDAEMLKRYPPTPLEGVGSGCCYWSPK